MRRGSSSSDDDEEEEEEKEEEECHVVAGRRVKGAGRWRMGLMSQFVAGAE